jgi:hypothetical protein
MKLPKLHSWMYHIVDSIREFGAVNGYTTETYESLHKTYIKIPYRLSNKKDVEKQIMQAVNKIIYFLNFKLYNFLKFENIRKLTDTTTNNCHTK